MDKTCLSGEGQRDSVSSPFLDPFELYRTSSRPLSPISTQQRDQPRRWAFVTDQEGLDHIQTCGERQRRCSCPESDNTWGFWQYCLNYLIGDWDWKEWAWARGRGQWRPWKVIFESLDVQLYDHKHCECQGLFYFVKGFWADHNCTDTRFPHSAWHPHPNSDSYPPSTDTV